MAKIAEDEATGNDAIEVLKDGADTDFNIPFGEEIKTDRASVEAYFGEVKNDKEQKGSDRQTDETAGGGTQEGASRVEQVGSREEKQSEAKAKKLEVLSIINGGKVTNGNVVLLKNNCDRPHHRSLTATRGGIIGGIFQNRIA